MQNRNGKGAILRIVGIVKDAQGTEISRFAKDNDIYLWNWAVLVAHFLKMNFCPADATTYAWKGIDGTTRGTTATQFPANGNWTDYYGSAWKVQIGGGTTGAAVTDVALQSFIQEVTPTLPEIITADPILKIAFSSTFAFTSQTVVSETAIKANGMICAVNQSFPYLITRDTFTPQTVPAGGSITIQHELWFNGTPPVS
jgi:hypothetical protein